MDDTRAVKARIKRIISLMKKIEKEMSASGGDIINVEITSQPTNVFPSNILLSKRWNIHSDEAETKYFREAFPDFIAKKDYLVIKIDGIEIVIPQNSEDES